MATKSLVILLVLINVNCFSQSTCSVKFRNLKLLESGLRTSEFYINGKRIIPDSTLQTIGLVEDGFDTLRYYIKGELRVSALTKFRSNDSYVIALNPCSFYTLYPKKERKLGVVRFEKIDLKETYYGLFDGGGYELTDAAGEFLPPEASAMCTFSRKIIAIANERYYEDVFSRHDKIIVNQAYHFLHGEKLSVQYVPNTNSLAIEIVEYLKKGESYQDYID